jgi:hypothetical protein
VASHRKRDSTSIQLEVDGTVLVEPTEVSDAFAKHLLSVYNIPCPGVSPLPSRSSEFLSLAPISELEICKALKRLRPSKAVALDGIPSFIIKGCSEIFIRVLKHIFNLSLSQQYFSTEWKQAAIVPVFKKATVPPLAITDPFLFSIIFPNYLNSLFMTIFHTILSSN